MKNAAKKPLSPLAATALDREKLKDWIDRNKIEMFTGDDKEDVVTVYALRGYLGLVPIRARKTKGGAEPVKAAKRKRK